MSARKPIAANGPMAMMIGGRRDGWVYYDSDLIEVRRIARDQAKPMGYTRTDDFTPHPHLDATCRIWRATE